MLGSKLFPGFRQLSHPIWAVLCSLVAVLPAAYADQVEMQNGDRYAGTVLSLNADTLTLKSEVLGTLKLPRTQVALVALGNRSLTNTASPKHELGLEADAASPGATNLLPTLPQA